MAKLDYVSSSNGTTLCSTHHNLIRSLYSAVLGSTAAVSTACELWREKRTFDIWFVAFFVVRFVCFFFFCSVSLPTTPRWEVASVDWLSMSHILVETPINRNRRLSRLFVWIRLAAVVSTPKMSRSQFNCDLMRFFCSCWATESIEFDIKPLANCVRLLEIESYMAFYCHRKMVL